MTRGHVSPDAAREKALNAVRDVLRKAEGKCVVRVELVEDFDDDRRPIGERLRVQFADNSELEVSAKTFVPAFHPVTTFPHVFGEFADEVPVGDALRYPH